MTVSDAKKWFKIYYSQNHEDLILKAFFPKLESGFYIDVGAHDPEVGSVTKLFYEAGWRGINIEPQREVFKKLAAARKEDTNLNIAVGDKPGELLMREYPEASGLSTLSRELMDGYVKDEHFKSVTSNYSEYKVEVQTLKQIFSQHAKAKIVNFMKVDVEGFENEVLTGNDWEAFRPQLLCIEANHLVNDWHGLLKASRYKKIFFDGLNEYFAAEEVYDKLLKGFSYTEAVLSQIPINSVPFELFAQELTADAKELKKLYGLVERQNQLIQQRDEELRVTRDRLERIENTAPYRLARSVKRATKGRKNS